MENALILPYFVAYYAVIVALVWCGKTGSGSQRLNEEVAFQSCF